MAKASAADDGGPQHGELEGRGVTAIGSVQLSYSTVNRLAERFDVAFTTAQRAIDRPEPS